MSYQCEVCGRVFSQPVQAHGVLGSKPCHGSLLREEASVVIRVGDDIYDLVAQEKARIGATSMDAALQSLLPTNH